MSSFDIPKQFGDPQWSSKYQNNIVNKRENREVNSGVKKQDTGAFGDLESFMKASNHYAKQRKEAGKPTDGQVVTDYTRWLDEHPGGNLLTEMRKYHEGAGQIEAY